MLIGTIIRKWRRAEDIGVREAARQIGVTHGTLSRIERGMPMDAATLVKLLAWMFSEPGAKPQKRKKRMDRDSGGEGHNSVWGT